MDELEKMIKTILDREEKRIRESKKGVSHDTTGIEKPNNKEIPTKSDS